MSSVREKLVARERRRIEAALGPLAGDEQAEDASSLRSDR